MMTQTQGQGRLPTAYQEVEYIECQGDGAYINTDIKGDVSITTSLDGCFTSTATGTKVFLGLGTSAGNWIGQYNRKYAVGTTSAFTTSISSSERKTLIATFDSNGCSLTVDNETVSREGTHSASNYFNIFFSGTTYTPSARVYEASIYQLSDNTLIRHFIPCYRKADSEIGLYDLVTNTFFNNNSSSGTFLKGNDV